ncbi:hypothetical protein C922_04930 [Plasmodium inui San Antonio 1]|uniref:RRM domain-containing protein n=1 Tax=Plasmodium inui San Antonio 1 TaxID=1237626 RepID=W7A6F1_9APIC|nr:hypothetical protein C922_04930 [Plasmodium inui San Antonio 1]EUD64674.1 hypothetical protein C922_04930 [Plasmodium inui San Antonio 1]
MASKSNYSLWIGNIPFDATERELEEILSKVGQVVSVRIKYDVDKNLSKGFAFCEYKDLETCMLALKYLNGYELKGRKLRLYWANDEFRENLASGAFSEFASDAFSRFGAFSGGGLLSRGRGNEYGAIRIGAGLPPPLKGSTKLDASMGSNGLYSRKGKGQLTYTTNTERNVEEESYPLKHTDIEINTPNQSNMKKVLISNIIHTLTTSQIMCILSFFKKYTTENTGMMQFYFQRHRNVAYALLHCLFLMNVISEYTIAKSDLQIVISDEALMNKAERMTQMRRSGKLKKGLSQVADVEGGATKRTDEEEQQYNPYQRDNPRSISHGRSDRRGGRLLGENVTYDLSEDNPLGGSTYGGPQSHVLNLTSPPSVGGSTGVGKTKRGGTTTTGLYAITKKEVSNLGNAKGGISNGEETEECTGRDVKYEGCPDQYSSRVNPLYPEGNSHTSTNSKQRRRMKKEFYRSAIVSGSSLTYQSNIEQLQDGRYNEMDVGIDGGVNQLNSKGASDFKLNYLSDYATVESSMGINATIRIGGGEVNTSVGHTDRRYHVPRGGGSDVGNDEGSISSGLKQCKGERIVHPFDKAPTERSDLDMRSDLQDMVSNTKRVAGLEDHPLYGRNVNEMNGSGEAYSVNYVEADGRSGNEQVGKRRNNANVKHVVGVGSESGSGAGSGTGSALGSGLGGGFSGDDYAPFRGSPPENVPAVENSFSFSDRDRDSGNSSGHVFPEKRRNRRRQGLYGSSSGSYMGRGAEGALARGDVAAVASTQGPPNEGVLSHPTYANVEVADDELVNEVVKNKDILNNILKSRVEDMTSWSNEQRVQVLSIQKALQLKGYGLQ